MAKIIVKKSNPLKGSVKIDGAKNAVLPIIAATLLAKGKSVIKEVPNLRDVHVISDLLRHLGAEVEYAVSYTHLDRVIFKMINCNN